MGIAIRLEHLSKEYRLGVINNGMLYKDIQTWIARKLGRPDPHAGYGEDHFADQEDRFWALKDLCLDIEQGDRIGVIGRNGAGKSTLLKILSRITAPTEGAVKIKGRVASLLEVGTGFHPELTGRENIYLNGAILGLKKRQVARKMDEIVAFSEIEQFIDTPVKRYSSGMYVRLAFAVAAHLDADILLADEVLAVGDAAFQRKCLGKMSDISTNEGRTVIFVSHNMAAVKSLCKNGILLERGKMTSRGEMSDVIKDYSGGAALNNAALAWDKPEDAPGNDDIRILSFAVTPEAGDVITDRSGIAFKLQFHCFRRGIRLDATFELSTLDGILLFHDGFILTPNKDSLAGQYSVEGRIPPNMLNAGKYRFKVMFGDGSPQAMYVNDELGYFEIMDSSTRTLPGALRPNIAFKAECPTEDRGRKR